ncbi:hypothetical protein CSB45_02165 [candidate division KSB3 bacterium]|uniref:NACHT domain-containing protein n=1 Tax=candidate division KSB3 bacterium TaxID=2044937 RepID=A0A2G6E9S0_9BACT|nr:MAG: hypothetical protein CSB45_02165 [candidate division KSB3 bacterium]PIE30887.1 MAG: hypothetical protein CSA57_00775 [candidate division KSB3 bacterium]
MGETFKKSVLLLCSQIPLFAPALLWRQQPLAAVILAGSYELLIFVWGFVGRDVWEALKPDVVKALTDWIKTSILNAFSGFRKRYKKHVTYDHRGIGTRGLRTPARAQLALTKVFVDLQLAPSHASQVSSNPLEAKSLPGSQTVWTFLQRLKSQKAVALAILGPPGCGKSTLLKYLALTFAGNKQRRYHLRAFVPILLFLREHARTIHDESPTLAELAQAHFANPKRYPELEPPATWFQKQLRAGRCLVLLDGLDEVAETLRNSVVKWVDRQIVAYPNCCFVLTARPKGYVETPLNRAQVLEVLPFSSEQAERFVRNWYLATMILSSDIDDPGIQRDADLEADDLLERLRTQPALEKLTVNPLLLTMIANVHNYRGALPKRRVELYAEICDVLLEHWQSAKGIDDELSAAQKRAVLYPVAESMMARQLRTLPFEELQALMDPHLKRVGQEKVLDFLTKLQDESGLLLEQESGVWGFAHLTFQEYLCAASWKERSSDEQDWRAAIHDDWWHEVLRLYAAQVADASPLIRTCMDLGTAGALKLGGNIAEEALTVDPDLREALKRALEELPDLHLRSAAQSVSTEEFERIFELDSAWRPLAYIHNQYERQGDVVLDRATGLIWQQSGSSERLSYAQAADYVEGLNAVNWGGFADWRLPTIPELLSLLDPERSSSGLYIDPIFDVRQLWCWSADRVAASSGSAWGVNFSGGGVHWGYFQYGGYVRCVRS